MSGSAAVDAYLADLNHSHLAGIRRLRAAILDVDDRLVEHVKWNAPSFQLGDHDLLTMRLAPRDAFQLVLHRGAAKVAGSVSVDDPEGLLEWRGPDRAVIDLRDDLREAEIEPAVKALVRAWIAAVT